MCVCVYVGAWKIVHVCVRMCMCVHVSVHLRMWVWVGVCVLVTVCMCSGVCVIIFGVSTSCYHLSV